MVAHNIEHFVVVFGALSKEVAKDLAVWAVFFVDVFRRADVTCKHEDIAFSGVKALRGLFALEVKVRE
jgi:hypothetical protein